jgi:SAM-dependent methyltransferase
MAERVETWDSFWGQLLRIDFFEGQWDAYRKVADSRAEWLEETFGLDRERPLLSLACGEGGIELALARRGFNVTGIDRCTAFIHYAREQALAEKLDASFIVGDIRRDSPLPSGNGTVALFDTLGLLGADDEVKLMQRIAESLAPDGIMLMDAPLRESLKPSRNWWKVRNGYLLYDNRWDKASAMQHIEPLYIEEDGTRVVLEDPYNSSDHGIRGVERYVYADREMVQLAGGAGLPGRIIPHQRGGYMMMAASSKYRVESWPGA